MLTQKFSKIYFGFFNIALFVLVLILPFINNSVYANPTISSKTLFFIWGLIIISVIYMLNIIFRSNPLLQLKLSKIEICVFILFVFITTNRYIIQPDYGFSIRYIELLELSVLYLILRNLSLKSYVWVLLAIVLSAVIQAIYGNLQILGYYPSNHSGFKLTGSFFNPGPYAGFIASVWPIAFGMYLFKEKIVEQIQLLFRDNSKIVSTTTTYIFEYIPLLGVISILLVIPATHSRSAWLAVLFSSLLLTELRYHFIKNILEKTTQLKKIALIILVLLTFFTGLFGIYHFKKGSADGRLFIWKVTTEIIKDFPITGVGFDRFKAHYMNYQADYFAEHCETTETLVADNTYYAFNEWLQFVAENGIIGCLLLILLLYTLFKIKVVDKNNCLLLITKVTLLGIGIFALFSYPMQILPIKVVMVVAFALLAKFDLQKYIVFKIDKSTKLYVSWGFRTAIFAISIVGLSKVIGYSQEFDLGFKTWKKALTIYQYGDYGRAIDKYAKVYPSLRNNGDFLMNYGKALSINKQDEKAIQILEQAKKHLNTTIIETALGDAYKGEKQYKEAEIAYTHAANMIPGRFYPLYLLAKLYEVSNEKEKAVAMANNILNKEVKIPSRAIKEIKQEMKNIITISNSKK